MKAADCKTMAEIRAEIDRLDAALVALFAERAGYIDRAAQIKGPLAMPARIEARVEEVVMNVGDHARAAGLDADLYQAIWRQVIDWSIAREEKVLGI
ncbi:chorismate mutase [Stagnihabitans tardus]|uniref:chorismate mutase n=1 Tax=Stagnihabitans tardus TaxID=2699202 RepID=A0AAE4YCU8_9RHOB|nr:chorismate mutase [Stagnihabitans tardus]NBZ87285.1 chorismate mutase family protein [Stagnihabitans tardus]